MLKFLQSIQLYFIVYYINLLSIENFEKEVKIPSNIKTIKFSPYVRDIDGFSTFMKCLSTTTDLENLDLSENLIPSLDDLNTNINNKYLTKLNSLNLSGNKITNLAEFSTNLVNLQQLEMIDLSCNNFYTEDEGLSPFFKNLSSISKLKSLNISYNSFVNVEEFGNNLKYLPELTNLKMLCVNIKNKGIKELSESFKTITNLTELDISLNRVDEESGKELCSGIPSLISLSKLKMNNMNLNNSHLEILLDSLSGLTNLKELDFSGNITDGKEELQQSVKDKYPNCQISI